MASPLPLQFWVFLMISLQPFFIKGLSDIKKCRNSSMGAAIMFVVSFCTSLGYAIYASTKKSKSEETWKLQETKAPSLPEGLTDYTPNIPTSSFHAMGPSDGVVA
jgi:hypothetical protein